MPGAPNGSEPILEIRSLTWIPPKQWDRRGLVQRVSPCQYCPMSLITKDYNWLLNLLRKAYLDFKTLEIQWISAILFAADFAGNDGLARR